MLIDVAKLERAIRASIADTEQAFFARPPATLEDMQQRIGRRLGLNDALEIIAAIVKEEDDEE